MRGVFLDGGGSKKPGVSLEKWKPVVRELLYSWYWSVYTSSGDIKSVGKNCRDSMADPLVETSIYFVAMRHAEWGREAV